MNADFLVTSLIVVAAPGTGALLTLAAGLSRGARAATVAAFGCTLGIVPHMLAAITGLAAVLHASAAAFQVIKYLGVAYLLYMAVMTVRAQGPLAVTPDDAPRATLGVIRNAVLVNLLNPKLSIFFLAFLPQFIARDDAHPVLSMAALSLVFMAMTLAIFTLYGVFAAGARRHILSRPRVMTWMRRSFAAAFVGLGVRLALAQR